MKKLNALVLLTIIGSSFVVVGCSKEDPAENTANAPLPASDARMQKEQGNKAIKPTPD